MNRQDRNRAKHNVQSTAGKLFFYDSVLGVELEDYQTKAVVTIHENERTAISACHDLGKSFLLAREMLYYGAAFPNTKIVTTAPTWRQVESILWAEARAAFNRSKFPLGGKMLTTEWKLSPEWFAIGFSPKNEANAESGQGTQSTFQGFHPGEDGYLIVIFDEATGIPLPIWTMAEGLLTSGRVKFIAIGNPTSMQSEFYRCFLDRGWAKVKWSCFNSPNLIANGMRELQFLEWELDKCRAMNDGEFLEYVKTYKTPKPHLITLKWVVEKTLKWGIQHPLTQSKILGEFPIEGDNVKMPLSIVMAAQAREIEPPPANARRSFGIDVARYGSDKTSFVYLHGAKQTGKKSHVKKSTTEVVGEAIQFMRDQGGKLDNGETRYPDVIVVDETGLGGGVVDLLIENQCSNMHDRIPQSTEIRGVQFGAHPAPKTLHDREDDDAKQQVKELADRYVNMKARMYDLLAEDLKSELALMDDATYTEELPTILYSYDSKGRLKIESKDDYKKRTGRGSPDDADGLALANFGRHDMLNVGTFTKNMIPNRISSITAGISIRGRDAW